MLADIYTVTGGAIKQKCSYVHNSSLLFCMEKHCFIKWEKDTVDHMQQGPIHCAQQNNQTRHKNCGIKKGFGSREKRKELKPGMLSIEVSEYKFV